MSTLTVLANDDASRSRRDRLELLTALVEAPGFDPLYRSDLIAIPPRHPVYGWECAVEGCGRVRVTNGFCYGHRAQWDEAQQAGNSRAAFIATASPCEARDGIPPAACLICPGRTADRRDVPLCHTHLSRWKKAGQPGGHALQEWLSTQAPLPGFGDCQVEICPDPAGSIIGLCWFHRKRYVLAGRPGDARLRPWRKDPAGPVRYADEAAFRRWCASATSAYRLGLINLRGLQPLIKTEIQWGLHQHAQAQRRSAWRVNWIQRFADLCRTSEMASLVEYADHGHPDLIRSLENHAPRNRMIFLEIAGGLRCIYYAPADTKDAGYIETEHFGRRFTHARSYFDITDVSQRWLRDLLWEHLAEILRSPRCPRSRGPIDDIRRACVELSAFLETGAPGGGHDPRVLRAEHGQRFAADLRQRQRHGLRWFSGIQRRDGKPSVVTEETMRTVLTSSRRHMHWILETGNAAQIGLDPRFITAFPAAGIAQNRSRSPFTDDVARALADEANLRDLEKLDPADNGLRDAWGGDRLHRAALQRDPQAQAGLHRPVPRPAGALARPDQGRQL